MIEHALIAISGISLTDDKMKTIVMADSAAEIRKKDGLLIEYDLLIWKLAIQASQGRIPEGTDISRRMFLTKLPNMSRLKFQTNALKISTLWAEKPCTLSMTTQHLNIPQREVFTFFSAAKTLDLIEYSNLYSEPEFRIGGVKKYIQEQTFKKENMLGRIMKKIGLKRKVDLYAL